MQHFTKGQTLTDVYIDYYNHRVNTEERENNLRVNIKFMLFTIVIVYYL